MISSMDGSNFRHIGNTSKSDYNFMISRFIIIIIIIIIIVIIVPVPKPGGRKHADLNS